MEKLIELFYEYKLDLIKREMRANWADEKWIDVTDTDKLDEDELEKNLNKLSELKPFIKWLVENDKINIDKLETKVLKENLIRKFDEWLLMLLSISPKPIEDLISYLK